MSRESSVGFEARYIGRLSDVVDILVRIFFIRSTIDDTRVPLRVSTLLTDFR